MAERLPIRRDDQQRAVEPWRDRGGDLWRWDPFRGVDTLFDRLMRNFGAQVGSQMWGEGFLPAVDVEETDNAYIFEIELPGVRKEDISIECGDQELHITGQVDEKERTGTMRQRTRHSGSFDYRTSLPAGLDTERAEARFDDGVLTVTIPKTEAAQRRKIKIS
jgi:HSP20 family protein